MVGCLGMKRAHIGALTGALFVATAVPAVAKDDLQADWRRVATPDDRVRLRNTRQAWLEALAKARAAGQGKAIAAQGVLFDPDRALAGAKPLAGDYRCRVFKLGGKRPGNRDYIAYPAFRCRIDPEGEMLSLYKIGGSQRPVGLIFDDGRSRQIFLGTLSLGDEQLPMDYGRDANRDMAGIVERIGPRRWRLVLPYPHFESLLDVVELVPIG
jgi:hypothetical protein